MNALGGVLPDLLPAQHFESVLLNPLTGTLVVLTGVAIGIATVVLTRDLSRFKAWGLSFTSRVSTRLRRAFSGGSASLGAILGGLGMIQLDLGWLGIGMVIFFIGALYNVGVNPFAQKRDPSKKLY